MTAVVSRLVRYCSTSTRQGTFPNGKTALFCRQSTKQVCRSYCESMGSMLGALRRSNVFATYEKASATYPVGAYRFQLTSEA